MKSIARFVKRGRDGEKDNAAVMIIMPGGGDLLKQDIVYEVVEVLGVMTIRELGKTHMDPKKWAWQIQDVMLQCQPVMTQKEAERLSR